MAHTIMNFSVLPILAVIRDNQSVWVNIAHCRVDVLLAAPSVVSWTGGGIFHLMLLAGVPQFHQKAVALAVCPPQETNCDPAQDEEQSEM
jgi:hypothetical protein